MSNQVTIKFNVTSKIPTLLSEFFHLDAEIIHEKVDEFQILSFDQDTGICVAELFIGDMNKNEFQKSIDLKKISISIDNHEMAYHILNLY